MQKLPCIFGMAKNQHTGSLEWFTSIEHCDILQLLITCMDPSKCENCYGTWRVLMTMLGFGLSFECPWWNHRCKCQNGRHQNLCVKEVWCVNMGIHIWYTIMYPHSAIEYNRYISTGRSVQCLPTRKHSMWKHHRRGIRRSHNLYLKGSGPRCED